MRKYGLLGVMLLLLGSTLAYADLTVSAGNWTFLPNTGTHSIPITISGTGNVYSATLILGITGPGSLPALTGGDILTGTIFASNHNTPITDFTDPTTAYMDVITNHDTVPVSGDALLGTVLVDTTGMGFGPYSLNLTSTPWGDTAVATTGAAVTYVNGSISVPEPAPVVCIVFALGMALIHCRRNVASAEGREM